ncbi:type I-C CRISPR-associated protein Cas7/Csd2 [Bacillus carboniphilus]|uniref:Type I-C CRISPR-associated protein Cas7/Csd2 n=1 Tax=Bacillus carboniphilus TaxID=86663 RepID=A0ABY9JWL8_9BACI|nr:type I-C CRISPR-associated protein Cas7/Csd2 [Bacillus carboniphilus]WLR42887.1 type I-C CRISPR-associated protein Cas7/Csd2 [Bacillus carboniphilus]
MEVLNNKIDFAVVVSVKNANPNGDPLNGNRPRQNYEGYGEISDVCLKRKIRNRLQDMEESIFVQSDERKTDQFKSLKDRADSVEELKKAKKGKDKDIEKFMKVACKQWIDVRSFGQIYNFEKGQSVGIRGPVSIHSAYSIHPIDITSMQITKSVNNEASENKDSSTFGEKHRVDFGVYVFYGSVNTQLAEKTDFTRRDADKIKESLQTLFENDSSSARPDGSMEVHKLYWWEHNSKFGQYSSAKVHRSLKWELKREQPKSIEDVYFYIDDLEGLKVDEYEGN